MAANRIRIIFPLLLVLAFTGICRGDCLDSGNLCKEAETTIEMQTCLGERLNECEVQMTQRLMELMTCLSQDRQHQLLRAQQVWLEFRELNADFEAGWEEGGSLFAVERLAALVEMTKNRVAELKRLQARCGKEVPR